MIIIQVALASFIMLVRAILMKEKRIYQWQETSACLLALDL